MKWVCSWPGRAGDRALEPLGRQREVGVAGEVARQELRGVDDHRGAGLHRRQHLLVAGHHDVAAEHQVGAAGRDADGVDVLGPLGDPHVAVDRAALLREAGHVDDADALALEMRRHAEDAADGDDAGAADAGDDDVVGLAELRHAPAPAAPSTSWSCATPLPFFSFAPCTVTNDGQKPFTQEKSLLQDDWSMVRLRPNSVSSGCTETQFDFTPQSPQPSQTSSLMMTRLSGIGERAALSAAALLGGAGLVVDQDGAAGDFATAPSAPPAGRRDDGR